MAEEASPSARGARLALEQSRTTFGELHQPPPCRETMASIAIGVLGRPAIAHLFSSTFAAPPTTRRGRRVVVISYLYHHAQASSAISSQSLQRSKHAVGVARADRHGRCGPS